MTFVTTVKTIQSFWDILHNLAFYTGQNCMITIYENIDKFYFYFKILSRIQIKFYFCI